ncbi:hypothetical protein FDP41_008098 [Naegleria fowleri]|uniref:PARP catalytic domain-containing protein n=1 Tax=Naegleria fowleri TaxID=5763 RepID=A0A6A5BH90_NAEFO|nr:uncharacterized protein FDP41_008098 [Naegleria fowleri]KAF0973394.1 hypothetical protein FDP41_008098 [Naegleria fowleri]
MTSADEPTTSITSSTTTETTRTSSDSSSSTTSTMVMDQCTNASSTSIIASETTTTTTIKESGLSNKIRVLSLSVPPHTVPQYLESDLKELQSLKETLQYKPTVLHLLSLYQSEIKKEVEFKQKKKNSSSSSSGSIVHVQVDPVPPDRKYIYLTSSGAPAVPSTCSCIVDYSHYLSLHSGKSIMNEFDLQTPPEEIAKVVKKVDKIPASSSIESKKNELIELEKRYAQLMQEKQKVLADRASVLTPEELASIEEEEGIRRKPSFSQDAIIDEDEWELEHKRKIIEQERKLVEKRLLEEKKHRNVRFYCKGELEYLQQWNAVFSSGEKKPSNLEELRKYSLRPTNVFDLEGEQIHYRFCESQFHRLGASPAYASSYPTAYISEVEYVVNPNIMNRFNNCKKELAKKHGFLLESMKPLLLFHGTSETNMENILRTNFLIEKIGSTTDMGWYGKGFYFSEYPGLSMAYSRNQYLLICMVLIGKAFHMNQVETGRPLEPGYDSHVSPDGCSEVIIFNPDQVIPLYKIKWEHSGSPTYK